MSAAFFVIVIPTEEEEKHLRNKQKKIRFEDLQKASIPSTSKNEEKSIASPSRSFDLQYGTFSQISTPSQRNRKFNKKIDNTVIDINDSKSSDILNDKLYLNEESPKMLRKSWEGLKDLLSAKKNSTENKQNDSNEEIQIPHSSFMETVMKEILEKTKINNSTWSKTQDGNYHQIMFTIQYDERYDKLMRKMHEWGIGERKGSSVSILSCSTFNIYSNSQSEELSNTEEITDDKQGAWNRFLNSIRARLNVAQIVESVKQDAAITFDFVLLIVIAAILAAFGLVENSTIFLASSMLISPLMGPIIAAIFGTVIKDNKLQNLGLTNELFGIFLATFVGFLFGLIICSVDARYSAGEGLTEEMLSRCDFHSLIVGIFTALPSGAAVAIAILGENIGSLVGVAISASLLPPAVNAGVLWSLACIYMMFEQDGTRYNSIIKTNSYSDHQAMELAILGGISMCVTITNVICIYVMGILLLKIKEVAPIASRNYRQFWKHDIKIARDFNKSSHSDDNKLSEEFSDLQNNASHILKSVNARRSSYHNTWSPMGNRNSIDQLEQFYKTIARPYPPDIGKLHRASVSGNVKAGIAYRSPPQFRQISEEYFHRPIDSIWSPKHQKSNTEQLEKVSETQMPGEGSKMSSRDHIEFSKNTGFKKFRKFIITPAMDPLQTKKS